jgi:hypothetical protein
MASKKGPWPGASRIWKKAARQTWRKWYRVLSNRPYLRAASVLIGEMEIDSLANFRNRLGNELLIQSISIKGGNAMSDEKHRFGETMRLVERA